MQSTHQENLDRLRATFPPSEIQAEGAFARWGATYLDAGAYIGHLRGKTWDQLDQAYIVRRSDALGFLSTPQLLAVLPAYLHALAAAGPDSEAAGVLTIILQKPTPGTDSGLGLERFNALAEALTARQQTAVAQALDDFSKEHSSTVSGRAAKAALDGYWRRYLPAAV